MQELKEQDQKGNGQIKKKEKSERSSNVRSKSVCGIREKERAGKVRERQERPLTNLIKSPQISWDSERRQESEKYTVEKLQTEKGKVERNKREAGTKGEGMTQQRIVSTRAFIHFQASTREHFLC